MLHLSSECFYYSKFQSNLSVTVYSNITQYNSFISVAQLPWRHKAGHKFPQVIILIQKQLMGFMLSS